MLQRVMYASKQIFVVSCVAAMIGCNSGHDDSPPTRSSTSSPPPAPAQTSQTPPSPANQPTRPDNGAPSATDANSSAPGLKTQPPPATQAQPPTAHAPGVAQSAPVPSPATGSAPTLGDIEGSLPPVSPYDTYGGQLLVGYLNQQIPDVEVVNAVFAQDEFVLSNLAEMSLAVRQLQQDGKYTPTDGQQVQVLEGALTDFLNARVASDQALATTVQYGTAAALGVIGGLNADRIVNGVKAVGAPLFGAPLRRAWNVTASLGRRAGSGLSQAGNWIKNQGSRVAESSPVTTVRDKSQELFTRAMAWNASRGAAMTTQERVVANISRALNSPTLAKGYRVVQVPAGEAEAATRLVYYKTGIPGFRINQREGDNFLTARIMNDQGEFEYFQVRGNAIDAMTDKGETMVLPAQTSLGLLTERLKAFGSNTVGLVEDTAARAKGGITNSSAYKYVTTDPVFQERLKRTAVGGTVGVMTLLALRSVDPQDLTLNGYVHDLQAQGIHLQDFIDNEQEYTQSATGAISNATNVE